MMLPATLREAKLRWSERTKHHLTPEAEARLKNATWTYQHKDGAARLVGNGLTLSFWKDTDRVYARADWPNGEPEHAVFTEIVG